MAGRRRDINTYQADEHQTEGEEEQDQQRQCLLCGKYPDSIICLSCDHCVDIPCAARIILQSQKFKDIDLSEIQCPACQQVTNLSEEVQATLIEYLQSESVEFDVGNEEQDEEGEEAYRADAGPEGENAGENEGEEEYEEEPEVMKHKSANKSHKSSQQQGSENKLIEKSVGSRGNRRVGSAKHQLSSR